METSSKTGFAQILSCCLKNLSCPKFGGPRPAVSTVKEVLMKKWNFIQNQPLLPQIFKEPPIISYKEGKSLKGMLVRAKI